MTLKVKDLPKILQNAMYSIDVEDNVITIGQRNGLHLDQVAGLHDLVSLVFLGDIKPQNFSREVAKQVGIPQEKADIITAEINAQIFQPLHDELMKIQDTEAVAPLESGTTAKSEELERATETEALHAALNPTERKVGPSPEGPTFLSGHETQAVAPLASGTTTNATNIHEEKLTAPTQTAQKETVIDHRTQKTLIPEDHKERINKDPYKENI